MHLRAYDADDMTVRERDLGWLDIKRELRTMRRKPYVAIGLQAGDDAHDGDFSTVELGSVHEFGSRDGRIPERSWLRSAFDLHRVDYQRLIDRIVTSIYAGRTTVRRGLSILGQKAETDAKKQIVDLKTPPNAPSTIARKGSSNPLIDTGRMLATVRHKINRL